MAEKEVILAIPVGQELGVVSGSNRGQIQQV